MSAEALALLSSASIRALILTAVGGASPAARDVYARAGEVVHLYAAVEVRSPGGCTWITEARGALTHCRILAPPAGISVDWLKLEAEEGAYDNVPGGRFTPAVIGFSSSPWRSGPWVVEADVSPVRRAPLETRATHRAPGTGTMRFRVSVMLPSGVRAESAAASRVPGGPPGAADARRVSVRMDDSYLGYLTELGGLPYIFGSTELGAEAHQAERRIGVDCADLMIYGLRRMGLEEPYRSSRTLAPISALIAQGVHLGADGVYRDREERTVVVGAGGLSPGDWLIFPGHVGAFFADRGQLGVLDVQDLMIHTAWREVALEPLADSGYGERSIEVRRPSALRGVRPGVRALGAPQAGVLQPPACRSRWSPGTESCSPAR